MQTRRDLLRSLAGLTAGAAVASAQARKGGYQPQICAQTYVWTQIFSRQKKPLGEGLEEMFAATRRAGYSRVELMGAMVAPDLLPRTAELLKSNRLDPVIVYAAGPMHEAAAAEKTLTEMLQTADAARTIGTRAIETNPTPKGKKERKTDDELATQSKALNRLAEALRERGMRLFVHHHDPEMADEAREWRHILKNTDPKLVLFCLDIDWVIRGGQQPVALLREAGGRLGSLHIRNSRQSVWTESLDEGEYDYTAVADGLKPLRYRGYVVTELAYDKATAITRPLEEDLRLSRLFLEKTFGGG